MWLPLSIIPNQTDTIITISLKEKKMKQKCWKKGYTILMTFNGKVNHKKRRRKKELKKKELVSLLCCNL